jgi:hypothetical protein
MRRTGVRGGVHLVTKLVKERVSESHVGVTLKYSKLPVSLTLQKAGAMLIP